MDEERVWTLNSVHEAVASFNFASLHLFVDNKQFPLDAVQKDPIRWSDGSGAAALSDLMNVLRNVPTPVLSHEVAHALQTATTPSGLREFFLGYVTEDHAQATIREALEFVTDTLPIGLDAMFSDFNEYPRTSSYFKLLALYRALGDRFGGLKLKYDESVDLDDLTARYPVRRLGAHSEDGQTFWLTLLGARHVYEGFGAIVEMLRSSTEGADVPDFPVDPYWFCPEQYIKVRNIERTRLLESLHECAVVLDTCLLADRWFVGDLMVEGPYEVYCTLLDVLQAHPELTLSSLSAEDVASFQNELMRHAGFAVTDVGEICTSLRAALPDIFEEITAYSVIPTVVLDDYRRCVDRFLDFRLEFFQGACPLEALVYGIREWIVGLAGQIPTYSGGIEIPLTAERTDFALAFAYQKARHVRQLLDEVVFGRRTCPVERLCVLPRRSACAGVTSDFTVPSDRCARESLIADMMSGWQVDRLS